jgi:hypothetical protein
VASLGVGQLYAISYDERTGAVHSGSACHRARRSRCPGLSDPGHTLVW